MEKSFYILITQQFAESMKGKQSLINPDSYFGYATTNLGQNVCSINSADDFPDDFATIDPFVCKQYLVTDFPITPPIE